MIFATSLVSFPQRIAAMLAFISASDCAAFAAQTEPRSVLLQTSDVDADHNYGVAEGSLRLTIGADGSILGYFRPVDQGRLIDVHGSLTGTKIYLYIGNDLAINGTYRDGKLDGYTLEEQRVHHFTGVTATTERP